MGSKYTVHWIGVSGAHFSEKFESRAAAETLCASVSRIDSAACVVSDTEGGDEYYEHLDAAERAIESLLPKPRCNCFRTYRCTECSTAAAVADKKPAPKKPAGPSRGARIRMLIQDEGCTRAEAEALVDAELDTVAL
jgi:hypothetical protein